MRVRPNILIRTLVVLVVWLFCTYIIFKDYDHRYFLDNFVHTVLIIIAAIVSIVFIYIDFRAYREQKNLSSFLPSATTVLCVLTFLVTTTLLKQQDRTPSLFYASSLYEGLNNISIDLRGNGTYKIGNSSFLGKNHYTRGRYTIKDSVVYLDKSKIYDLIVSDRLLIKSVPKQDSVERKGLLNALFGISHRNKEPETLLYQLDTKGQPIDSAIVFKVNKG